MAAGSLMDLNIEVRFQSGRRVRLDQLHLLPTMPDWADSRNPTPMEKRFPELVAKFFGTSEIPFIVKNEGRGYLPRTCVALFSSEPMEKYEVMIEHSLLIVCWFTQEVDVPIRQLACEGLAGVDWERHAKDFHSDW
jgi:hypothetical protein